MPTFSSFFQSIIYALLTKQKVKMAGYWPSYFFCTSMGQDKGMLHKNTQKKKKNKAITSILTKHSTASHIMREDTGV